MTAYPIKKIIVSIIDDQLMRMTTPNTDTKGQKDVPPVPGLTGFPDVCPANSTSFFCSPSRFAWLNVATWPNVPSCETFILCPVVTLTTLRSLL